MALGRLKSIPPAFWLEAGLAVVSGALFALTLFSADWIEAILPVDPDRGSGSLEWALVGILLLATVIFASRARLRWRRSTTRGFGDGKRQEA